MRKKKRNNERIQSSVLVDQKLRDDSLRTRMGDGGAGIDYLVARVCGAGPNHVLLASRSSHSVWLAFWPIELCYGPWPIKKVASL